MGDFGKIPIYNAVTDLSRPIEFLLCAAPQRVTAVDPLLMIRWSGSPVAQIGREFRSRKDVFDRSVSCSDANTHALKICLTYQTNSGSVKSSDAQRINRFCGSSQVHRHQNRRAASVPQRRRAYFDDPEDQRTLSDFWP